MTAAEEEEARSLSFQIGGLRSLLARLPLDWVQERLELKCSIDFMSKKLEQLRPCSWRSADAQDGVIRGDEDRQLALFPSRSEG